MSKSDRDGNVGGSDGSDADVPEPGLGALIAGGVVAFAVMTPVAFYLLSFNATQAVLLGGFSGLTAAAAAKLSARRQASAAGE